MIDAILIHTMVGLNSSVVDWKEAEPLVIGRQQQPSEPIGELHLSDGELRLAIVPLREVTVSRRQLKISRGDDGRLCVENLSPANPVKVANQVIGTPAHASVGFALPITVDVGDCSIRLERGVQTLMHQTRFQSNLADRRELGIHLPSSRVNAIDVKELVSFMSSVASVLTLSTNEEELCERSCEAIARLIDIDGVAVYKLPNWERVAGDQRIKPHPSILARVLKEQRVLWRESVAGHATETAAEIECYVSAPIVADADASQPIYGAIYAHRLRATESKQTFTEVHAHLVELVACTLAAGIVRCQKEKQVNRFEQFFQPNLAKKLALDNHLLQAQEREVTLLFCDIRGFSAVSERAGPALTSAWVQDVFTDLSECVHKFDGVLVDYIGDELMAMWGAPDDQPQHAQQACEAAIDMIRMLPKINDKWTSRIGSATTVGIGINSGPAIVGNTGSTLKFKYGPLGDTVNRASRVQGLTKYLKVPILITRTTKKQLPAEMLVRRFGHAKAVNLAEPIELFELITETQNAGVELTVFEEAIEHLEAGRLNEAARLLSPALSCELPHYPSMLAFREIVNRILQDKAAEAHYWDFGGK